MNPTPAHRPVSIVLALCTLATSLSPAALALQEPPEFPAPVAPPAMLAALAQAMDGPVPAAAIALPGPEEARAAAEARVLATATPERLARTLLALREGDAVAMEDWLVLGVVFHHADPAFAGTPLGDLAAKVAGPAVLRAAAAGLPLAPVGGPGADLASCAPASPAPDVPALLAACIAGAGLAPPFGALELLGSEDRLTRADTLVVRTESILDYESVTRRVESDDASDTLRHAYLYTFQSWWFAYDYFYNLQRDETAHRGYVEDTLTTLYQYRATFDRWVLSQGARVELLAQRTDLPAGDGAAHMLYAAVTPYAYLDHWWTVLAFEQFYREVAALAEHAEQGYWQEATTHYTRSGATGTQTSEPTLLAYGYTSLDQRAGQERLPFPEHTLLRNVAIQLRLPLGEVAPMARDGAPADLRTALHAELPRQLGVETKDRRISEALATFPGFTDLAIEVGTEAAANQALTTVDELTALAPVGGTVAFAPSLTGALLAPSVPLLAPHAAAVPPDALPEHWLVATYVAASLTTREEGAAGLGFVASAGPGPGTPIRVTVEALGLGLPVAFEVRGAGGQLVASSVAAPEAVPAVPAVPLEAPAVTGPRARTAALGAMPFELSFPGYLAERGVLSGEVAMEDAAAASVLATPPATLARTLARLAAGTSPEAPVDADDYERLQVLAYLAGPGADADPLTGAQARDLLARAAAAAMMPPPGEGEADASADEGAVFGPARLVATGGATLRHDAKVTSWQKTVERSTRTETLTVDAESYVDVAETLRETEAWSDYLRQRTEDASGQSTEEAAWERTVHTRSWYARVDTMSGVTTLVLRRDAAADGLQAEVLQTVVVPWRLAESAWMSLLLDEYEQGHLRRSATWWSHYVETVHNGQTTVVNQGDAQSTDEQTIFVETSLRTSRGRLVVPVPGGLIAPGAQVRYEVPARTAAPLPRSDRFDTSWLTGGVPTQLPTDREDAFFAEHFAVSPIPNQADLAFDEDPLAAGATAYADDGEAFLRVLQGDLEMLPLDHALALARLMGRMPPTVAPPGEPAEAGWHTVAFAAQGFHVGRPASVALALLAPADLPVAGPDAPDPVRIVVTAQAAAGAGNFGGADAFGLEHRVAGPGGAPLAPPSPPELPPLPEVVP